PSAWVDSVCDALGDLCEGALLRGHALDLLCLCPATPGGDTLSLHDALPICHDDHAHGTAPPRRRVFGGRLLLQPRPRVPRRRGEDRKSTRLNSSHVKTSYAVFRLKKQTPHTTANQREGAAHQSVATPKQATS